MCVCVLAAEIKNKFSLDFLLALDKRNRPLTLQGIDYLVSDVPIDQCVAFCQLVT